MKCYICGNTDPILWIKGVRTDKNLKVYECSNCGLRFLSSLDHISLEYYKNYNAELKKDDANDTMETVDTDRRIETYKEVFRNRSILDVGCGKGAFLEALLHQDITLDLAGVEPNQEIEKNIPNKIFSSFEELGDLKFDYITLFHVLEHISDPIPFLNDLQHNLSENGQIVIEVPNVQDALLSIYCSEAYNKFYYTPWHLYYYNDSSIQKLIKQTNYKIEYIKHIQRYPLSNHLFWLAHEKPGGHLQWCFLDTTELNQKYSNTLARLGATDTLEILLSKEK
jgi:2-polyprenyl-3-methyl-5-hydroxy-6-metoxy-1,4-benzoquinol methylase